MITHMAGAAVLGGVHLRRDDEGCTVGAEVAKKKC